MVRFQDIHVFSFLTIPWFTKSVTPWWVIVHETGCIYEYKFWTTTHYVTKLSQLIHINKGNNFQESLEQFGWLGLNSSSFSIQRPAPLTQQTVMLRFQCFIFIFEKVYKGHLKMVNVKYWKWPGLAKLWF